jgi:putative toxin-antitoxin system antitoxin component (TIGR02293 family)
MDALRALLSWLAPALDRAPEDPSARIAYRLSHMRPAARTRAEALIREAVVDFGSQETADRWLCQPVPYLGNSRPIDIIHSASGAAAVAETLHNLRYGIYS